MMDEVMEKITSSHASRKALIKTEKIVLNDAVKTRFNERRLDSTVGSATTQDSQVESREGKFNLDYQIADTMNSHLRRMKLFRLDTRTELANYVRGKCIDSANALINDKLAVDEDGHVKPYSNYDNRNIDEIQINEDEKRHFSEEHDFKEWE